MEEMLWGAAWVCLAIYVICGGWLMVGILAQLHLLRLAKASPRKTKPSLPEALPHITIQLPFYNERFVAPRLLEAVGKFDYPRELLDIQVLDDSTDETKGIVDSACRQLQDLGLPVSIIRRTERIGYKAGALQAGLDSCRGEWIAILDADFVPDPGFLQQLVDYTGDPATGMVQARWAHQNQFQNTLTIAQSILLDSHFTIEQQGRSNGDLFINFNGTAGIWRKSCIMDAGGWDGSVLSEDLDLSYRAQLKGWKLRYAGQVEVPSDLPADVAAFKTQQFRWAKGMTQVAVRHLFSVMCSKLPWSTRLHGMAHLLGSMSFLAVGLTLLMIFPMLMARHHSEEYKAWTLMILPSAILLPLMCLYYYRGTQSEMPRKTFWRSLPAFLLLYSALSIQNSVAVIQALVGHQSAFVGTPKGDVTPRDRSNGRWTTSTCIELLALIYALAALGYSIACMDFFLVTFLVMMITGLLMLLVPAMHVGLNGLTWKKTVSITTR